jgi:hypothetical protein
MCCLDFSTALTIEEGGDRLWLMGTSFTGTRQRDGRDGRDAFATRFYKHTQPRQWLNTDPICHRHTLTTVYKLSCVEAFGFYTVKKAF